MKSLKNLQLQMNIFIGLLLLAMGCMSVVWAFVVWADDMAERLPWIAACLLGVGAYGGIMWYLLKLEEQMAEVTASQILASPASWIAHWKYDIHEWKQFTDEELKGLENRHWLIGVILGVCIFLGASAAVVPQKGWVEGFAYTIGLTIFLSSFAVILTYVNGVQQRKAYLETVSPEIILTKDTALVSKQFPITLNEGILYTQSAQIIDKYNMKLMEFTVKQPMRRGDMTISKVIPIPKGKEDEALVNCLRFMRV